MPEVPERVHHQALALLGLRHVRLQDDGVRRHPLRLLDGARRRLPIVGVVERHLVAVAQQPQGNRLADAARASRHQGRSHGWSGDYHEPRGAFTRSTRRAAAARPRRRRRHAARVRARAMTVQIG